MKSRHVSKVIDVFSKNLFMSIRHMKKKNIEIPGSYYFSFFALSNLQTCLHFRRTGRLFFWTCQMYIYYLLLHLFAALCHILYFDAAKFSIKLFSLVYFFLFLLSDNRMNMKKWLKRDPLRLHNQLSLPRCQSAQKSWFIIQPSYDKIK